MASYPDHGAEFGVLLGAATRAVDAAVELGRDRSVIYCADVARMLDELPVPRGADEPRLESIIGLAEELDVRDTGSNGHCHTVSLYAELMAKELGLDPDHAERVGLAGVVHDIGKTGVSDRLISKSGPLNPDEWRWIRTAPGSAQLLAHPEFEDLRAWVLAHHERPDGGGYPFGLAGGEIPIEARILAVADAYEAMTSERSFRSALGDEVAVAELQAGAGTQFDAVIVGVFLGAWPARGAALPQAS